MRLQNNLKIINCEKPTYPRGKSIIYLNICSSQTFNLFKSHEVFKQTIGDHKPTLTTLQADIKYKTKSHKKKTGPDSKSLYRKKIV